MQNAQKKSGQQTLKLPSQSSEMDRQGRKESSDRPDAFWRKVGRRLRESRTLLEAIVVTVVIGGLVGALIIVWDRWTDEIGEHQKTTGRAERAEERERKLISERDQLAETLKTVQQENTGLKQKYPLLAFYGPRSKIVTSYDLRKETGSQLHVGNCPRSPCFLFTLGNMVEEPGSGPKASILFRGEWEGWPRSSPNAYAHSLSIKRGCYVKFEVPSYDIIFVIEEDRVSDLRAGIGISLASSPQIRRGIYMIESRCPKD